MALAGIRTRDVQNRFFMVLRFSNCCSSKRGPFIFDFRTLSYDIFDVLPESAGISHGRKRVAEIIFVTFEIASLAV